MNDDAAAPVSVTRKELYELIWAEPMTKVAPKFGLSDVGLAKLCKRYDIPRPPVGYWAKKEFGKAPARIPLPEVDEASAQVMLVMPESPPKPEPILTAADLVTDDALKGLIRFEEEQQNKIVVGESLARPHPFVRETKAALAESSTDRQGLLSPRWFHQGPKLDIHVGKAAIPRALRLMDALIKAFEKRGHRVVHEESGRGNDAEFVILGERFSFRLREKTKMVRTSESERKRNWLANKVNYVPAGELELHLSRKQGYAARSWKDGKRTKLEDQLNDVMIALIVEVERARNWRREEEAREKQRREEEKRRWQQEQENRREEQKIRELESMVQNWDRAACIRAFIAAVQATTEGRHGVIEEGSEMAVWIEWALRHADSIDPLGARSGAVVPSNERPAAEETETRPNRPR